MSNRDLKETLRQHRLMEKMLRRASLDVNIPFLVRNGLTEEEILEEIRESCKRLLKELEE